MLNKLNCVDIRTVWYNFNKINYNETQHDRMSEEALKENRKWNTKLRKAGKFRKEIYLPLLYLLTVRQQSMPFISSEFKRALLFFNVYSEISNWSSISILVIKIQCTCHVTFDEKHIDLHSVILTSSFLLDFLSDEVYCVNISFLFLTE